jgi:hypothetical protein
MALYLRQDLAAFQKNIRPLQADAQQVSAMKTFYNAQSNKLKVGICWRSSVMGISWLRVRQYASLQEWVPLLQNKNVDWVNLQYDDSRSECEALKKQFDIQLIEPPIKDKKNDMQAMEAAIAACDLIIGGSTAILAMAGALGVEAWVVHNTPIHLRLGQKHVPWFKQVTGYSCCEVSQRDDWASLFHHLNDELQQWYGKRGNL